MNNKEDILCSDDKDREQIRAELSHMSFEDLQKLKERLGTKVYNEAVFGPKKIKRVETQRVNKNRPREMSAKKPVPLLREVIHVKKNQLRDPRFDNLCGTFNEKAFKNCYSFLTKLRENDVNALKKELNDTEDPKRIRKIKYLIQRLENQLREEARQKEKKEKIIHEKKEIVESIKRGEKPSFKKKSEKKVLDLVAQYEELKNSGKLQKHIQRLRKKRLHKDRVKLAMMNSETP